MTTGAKKREYDADSERPSQKRSLHSITGGVEEDMIEEDMIMDDALDQQQEFVEDVLGEAGRNWIRPPPKPIDPVADSIVFQQLELDYTSGAPSKGYYPAGEQQQLEEVPIVRMYGVTKEGNSVCVFVHGFEPYFYVEAPTPTFSPDDCTNLAETLNVALAGRDKSKNSKSVLKVEIVQKQTILYYQPQKSRPFLKVSVALPNLVASSKTVIEQGLSLPWLGCSLHGPTYESNIPYALRYMIDASIVGGCWVELPAKSYTLVSTESSKASHCQVEAHVGYDSVISHPCEGEWSQLAPFRILSVDIECQGRKVRV
jgi:DNA polymerase delta subunit 1